MSEQQNSEELDLLRDEISSRYCAFGLEDHFTNVQCLSGGALLGVAFGIVEAYISDAIGFHVFFHGKPAMVPYQLLFHSLLFGVIGLMGGQLIARRIQLKTALRIIRRQYDNLKEHQQQLVQSEKLAVIGRLSASIAHEIRNPLGIMRSSAGLVADDLPADHPGREPLGFIAAEIDRISGLIESVLRLSKPKEPLLAPVMVNEVLDRTLAFIQPELRKRNIQVRPLFDDQLPECLADGEQIQQVFLGLVLNAIQAIGTDGTITVSTAYASDPQTHAKKVRIAVSDSGAGIQEQDLGRIFEPFFTTRAEGTGLGLAVARQIIDGHGGRITAESPVGAGATFSIFLPPATPAVAL